jgi:hypothetical protein
MRHVCYKFRKYIGLGNLYRIGLCLLLMIIGHIYSNLFFILFTCSRNYNDVVCCVSLSEAWSV